jgi:hypothetical protein
VGSPIEMNRGATKTVQQWAGVKKEENVVISPDTNKLRIAEALAAATMGVGGVPIIVMIPPPGVHGAQPPAPVVAACSKANVFFLPTTYSQTHTDARIQAIKNGARGATMCEVTEDALRTGAIYADYGECDRLGLKLGAILAKSKTVRIISPLGREGVKKSHFYPYPVPPRRCEKIGPNRLFDVFSSMISKGQFSGNQFFHTFPRRGGGNFFLFQYSYPLHASA